MSSSENKSEILRIVQSLPEGTNVPFIRDTLKLSDEVVIKTLEELIREGLVRKEEEFLYRVPYGLRVTYYPISAEEVPIGEPEYVHQTLVYNVKTGDDTSGRLDISITYDYDCKNTQQVKITLKKFLFLKSHTWLDAKFGDRVPRSAEWAETSEKPTDIEIVEKLKKEELEFTSLHYKWSYWRQFGNKSEEEEGDLDNWEEEIPTVVTWYDVKKGRIPKSKEIS